MSMKNINYIYTRGESWTMIEVRVVREGSHTAWHFNGVHMANHTQLP